MTTYPNQRKIRIHSRPIPPFAQINREEMYAAARSLTGAGFILWCYFASNIDGYLLELSKEDIINNCKIMSRASYYRGIEDLKEHGYLTDTDFYTSSQQKVEKWEELSKEKEIPTRGF